MSRSNYPLRLQTSLLTEARKLAAEEGASVNQFINTAVAEKVATLRTVEAIRLLNSLASEPPRDGDEFEGSLAAGAGIHAPEKRRKAAAKSKSSPRRRKRR